ncbi:prenyltransferase/squalene oxidase repeat-containing protein [Cytobacillus praedii]|uniref:prenyltransferase/squalene oxidase repeat-containing protein n=2 Tax=Cytobacillus praedii TaxID=1742358 RepID=UPI003F7CEC1E
MESRDDETQNHETIKDEIREKRPDLYTIYYGIEALHNLGSLGNEEKQTIINKFSELRLNDLINMEYNGSLYDIWLYINICKSLNIEVKYKEELLKFLSEVYTNEGYYLSFKDENINQPDSSFILSTKMAIEIHKELNIEIANKDKTSEWLKKVYTQLETTKISDVDYLSIIGFVNIISELDNDPNIDLNLNIINTASYKSFLHKLIPLYSEYPDSIEKYHSAIQLNRIAKTNVFFIDTEGVNQYLNSLQMSNGSFPFYESNNSDILSTSLAISLLTELDLEINKQELLLNFLEKSIKESL